MNGTNAEVLTKLVDRLQQGQRRQDQGQGDLRRASTTTPIAKYKAVDPEQVHPRRRAGLRHRHPLHDRLRAGRADAGLHRPRQGRHAATCSRTSPATTRSTSKLYSMPFNTSMPVLYINKDAFKKAGLDPAKPPTTLDEIRTAAREAGQGRRRHGRSTASAPRSTAGSSSSSSPTTARTYCDKGNGRDRRGHQGAVRPADSSVAGRRTGGRRWSRTAWPPTPAATPTTRRPRSSPARVAMTLESTGALRRLPGGGQGGKFEVGTAPLPEGQSRPTRRPDHRRRLAVDRRPGPRDAQKRAAWEFVKFLVAARRTRRTWHTDTGYFPISKARAERARATWRGARSTRSSRPPIDAAAGHAARPGHPGLPARRHAAGPQGLRGRPRGGARRQPTPKQAISEAAA